MKCPLQFGMDPGFFHYSACVKNTEGRESRFQICQVWQCSWEKALEFSRHNN